MNKTHLFTALVLLISSLTKLYFVASLFSSDANTQNILLSLWPGRIYLESIFGLVLLVIALVLFSKKKIFYYLAIVVHIIFIATSIASLFTSEETLLLFINLAIFAVSLFVLYQSRKNFISLAK